MIADNLKTAGWSLGWVSALDSQGRTIWIADAHHDGKRFVVQADEKVTQGVALRLVEYREEIAAAEGSLKPSDAL